METVWISLTAVALLLLANAFFVAAEFALVKARGFRLQATADDGSAAARLTLRIRGDVEPYLAACQLGITMASLGLGWIGEPAVAALLEPLLQIWSVPEEVVHRIAFVVGFLVFSSLHIVLGEQVPKNFAIRQAEPVSIWTAYPLRWFYVLAYPLTWLLDRASQWVLRIMKVGTGTHDEVLTLQELKGVVETSRAHGTIARGPARMLRNLVELDERPIESVMTPRTRLKLLDVRAAPETNLAILRDSGHSRFPVVDGNMDDDVVGVLLSNQLHKAMLNGKQEPWRRLEEYCREPLVLPERQTVSQAFRIMRNWREHMALVIDEYGQLVGIVTLEDLLEEIVGEIVDETDLPDSVGALIEISGGNWEADGLISLADLQREMGFESDSDVHANTLSGLFMEQLNKIPEQDDVIVDGGFRLTVLSVERSRAARVSITRLGDSD